ncbi:hypothetical protein K502DRAFT_323245 [Neoconidiobolus thromboides FSU 785]|nr:hypothetical protein K502DRAFT_323245 [Neoconidiobolus thromboides FSU 785]
MELISQGAEARVYKIDYLGVPAILKQRFKKTYRLPELDAKITKSRVLQEARSMYRCQKANIATPTIYDVCPEDSTLTMELISGLSIKELIYRYGKKPEAANFLKSVMTKIGKVLFSMHEINIIHGDLTTSNIMLNVNSIDADIDKESYKVVLIDFGLSYIDSHTEDKAVDLYVLERAFLSTHPESTHLFEDVLSSYMGDEKNGNKITKPILNRLEDVRLRGRKRSMIG